MFFASDNSGPAHPQVMAALMAANEGYTLGYGAEAGMAEVTAMLRDVFEAPEASVHLVATGTAANVLILGTLTKPWETVFCTKMSHINEDECNGPEFYTGGAKLTLVDSRSAKMTPDTLRAAILAEQTRGVHGPQRGPVSITQITEKGTVHTVDDLAALTAVARDFGLRTHLDGARFANALVALGCTPAEMTWKAGIDAVSFGGTKNGCLGVEACIFFDPAHAAEFEFRRKRGAHLFSKHRLLSGQMRGYLEDDLWVDLARTANARAARLADGLRAKGIALPWGCDANLMFFEAPRGLHDHLLANGATYYVMGDRSAPEDTPLQGRLVCDWSVTEEAVDRFLALS